MRTTHFSQKYQNPLFHSLNEVYSIYFAAINGITMAKAAKQTGLSKKEKNKQEAWWADRRWVSMIIAVVSFLLYSNSLTNGFVLDDSLVITKNSFTTQGVSGIKDIFTH